MISLCVNATLDHVYIDFFIPHYVFKKLSSSDTIFHDNQTQAELFTHFL